MNIRILYILLLLQAVLIQNNCFSQKEITLGSIYKEYRFFPQSHDNILSMNDDRYFTVLSENSRIEKYSYTSGEMVETLLDLKNFKNVPFRIISDYTFNYDESLLLLETDPEPIYRHSFTSGYYIYKLKDKTLKPLSDQGKQQLATFSPDGNKVAFVRKNNLYVSDLKTGKETQLTSDGKWNEIINGAPDWVYEEEFGFSKGFEWSPDSRRIAFYRFDESRVKEFNMTMYENLYPEWYSFKYPKAGEENALVTIHVADPASGEIRKMDTGSETDQYIPRIKWTTNPEVLSILRLNRRQDKLDILHANVNSGASEVVYTEVETEYIAQPTDDMLNYLASGNEFLILSERSGYKHIYRYDFVKRSIKEVTAGNFDVNSIIGMDEKRQTIYFTSCMSSPLNQDVYSIRTDGKKLTSIHKADGWNDASFSASFNYTILSHSTANQPEVTSLYDRSGKLIRVLEDNSVLGEKMKEYGFSTVEFIKVPTTGGIELNAFIIRPPDFDPAKKYPVFMYVYGGPESQNVLNRYNAYRGPWLQMLAQQGHIVVCADNRGTNGRGEAFRKSTYLQLGKLETEDQIEVAKYLALQPYVDKDKIGIFGWSYGGYMSLLCLFKGEGVFSYAISVAPVTNWRYYDTIYTERFMRKPQENEKGYDENSPIHFVSSMKGKLLLIHGMADDNVHFQNSAELVKALVESGKQFEMQFYPNKNHGIYGGNTSMHLYERIGKFIEENL